MPRPKSSFQAEHGEEVRKLYVDQEFSMQQIVEHYAEKGIKVNTQFIWRLLRSLRVVRRNASESAKVALKSKRAIHPTEGKQLSTENKENLSKSIAKRWQEITPEERERRRELSKKNYSELSDKKKRNLRTAAAKGVRKAAEQGSRLENHLVDCLTQAGYSVVFHKKGYIINDKLEIDILLPAEKVCIEVDGPTHSQIVYEGQLSKVQQKDAEKNGLLLSMGYCVIRLSNTAKTCSQFYLNSRWEKLQETLEKIKKEFPPADRRLIYIGENVVSTQPLVIKNEVKPSDQDGEST